MNFSQNFEQSIWANSVCADEVSASDYKRLLSLLEAIYAEAVFYLLDTVKRAWIVWMDSAIESTSHETWNG